jgi:hypothetical protein
MLLGETTSHNDGVRPIDRTRDEPAMTGIKKTVLIILGALAGLLLISQFVLGLIIVSGPDNVQKIVKMHQHTGYLTVSVALVYVAFSLWSIATLPTQTKS